MQSFVTIRIPTEMLVKVRQLAEGEGRTLAGMVRTLMRYGIEKVEAQKEAGR